MIFSQWYANLGCYHSQERFENQRAFACHLTYREGENLLAKAVSDFETEGWVAGGEWTIGILEVIGSNKSVTKEVILFQAVKWHLDWVSDSNPRHPFLMEKTNIKKQMPLQLLITYIIYRDGIGSPFTYIETGCFCPRLLSCSLCFPLQPLCSWSHRGKAEFHLKKNKKREQQKGGKGSRVYPGYNCDSSQLLFLLVQHLVQTWTVAELAFVTTGRERDCEYSAPKPKLHFYCRPHFMREHGGTDPAEGFLFPLAAGGKDACAQRRHEKACAATATRVQILGLDIGPCLAKPAVWHLPQVYANWFN